MTISVLASNPNKKIAPLCAVNRMCREGGLYGWFAFETAHHCAAVFQSLARAARVDRDPSVHRLGLRVEHLQPAVDSRVRRRDAGGRRLATLRCRLDLH